ncbi:glycosyltransferase family 2 protein [Lutibacter flavus]|uniref:Glycosyltransferase, catalytic subunit of cellulose synthase and poly-beta-1,6-N-acetylglucosamine synthase n=1 Tax=Lutibacter flavus TaxID=691689 RepID=A0A238ZCX6_9FLAO|nr:glycosyltransferase [Lutibacter flavus]SNR80811.1 Glycosyltransferase, catalytic subunit of cellulose synthase and poly-beta-1,6-N-acetylglucosamine synthase [Lutibacter flavus]
MIIAFIITFFYAALIIFFIIGFDKIETIKNKNIAPKNTFSIIIPFRNEAHNIPNLLKSLSLINYPKNLFEILLVNDASKDDYNSIIEHYKLHNPTLKLIQIENERTTNSPKKDAINSAIKIANRDWIITTDADCEVPKNWLFIFNQFIEEKKPLFISAPVKFKTKKGLLFHFQNLNFISLIGSTIGGFGIKKPFMCNGANLCYHKNTFFELNGFEGNSAIASGDDIFLLEKMLQLLPEKVAYLKSNEATVKTSSEKTWKLFFNQQIRWASKTTAYTSSFSKIVAATVFLENLMLILLGILLIFQPSYWSVFLILLVLKTIVDLILIIKSTRFLKSNLSLRYYLITCVFYPFYIAFISFSTLFKTYQWKGRTFKK